MGRHAWRYKERNKQNESVVNSNHSNISLEQADLQTCSPVNSRKIKCVCGKETKTHGGLKRHQRTCRAITGLNKDLLSNIAQEIEAATSQENEFIDTEEISNAPDTKVKKGVKLPKSESQWRAANAFFQANLSLQAISNGLEEACKLFSTTIYDYFEKEYGSVQKIDEASELVEKYRSYSKNQLKSSLKNLKKSNDTRNYDEIRYISKLLRNKIDKISGSEQTLPASFDHDNRIKQNYWKYAKNQLEKVTELLPSFSNAACFEYFSKLFKKKRSAASFTRPDWMPSYENPEKDFNCNAPTYAELNKIIGKMRTASAACPLDQISIITLKRCPYLRTYLLEIIRTAWESKQSPADWKQAITVLIHKKGPNDDPQNFRPITLQCVFFEGLYLYCTKQNFPVFERE